MICIKEIDKLIYDNLNSNYHIAALPRDIKRAKKQLEFYREVKNLLEETTFSEDYYKQELQKLKDRLDLINSKYLQFKANNYNLTSKQAETLFNKTFRVPEIKKQLDILTFILKGSTK